MSKCRHLTQRSQRRRDFSVWFSLRPLRLCDLCVSNSQRDKNEDISAQGNVV